MKAFFSFLIIPALIFSTDGFAKKGSSKGPQYRHIGVKRGAALIIDWASYCQEGLSDISQLASPGKMSKATQKLGDWVRAVSSDQLDITWDVFGPFISPYPQECEALDAEEITAHAMESAIAAYPSADLCEYDYLLVYPSFGTIRDKGSLAATGFQRKLSIGDCEEKYYSVSIIPWEYGSLRMSAASTIRHEFGHSLGLPHGWSWDCGEVTANYSSLTFN